MTVMLSATFDTRREAEMTVERLVQQFDLDRTAIFVRPEGDENSAGDDVAGLDAGTVEPGSERRDDAPLNSGIVVTVEIATEAIAEQVRDAFGEFNAAGVVETDRASRA